MYTMSLLCDIVPTKRPRRFRLKQVKIIGTQEGPIDCSKSGFMTREPIGGELIVRRYRITDSNSLQFEKSLTIPIPRHHVCHIAPKNRYHGSLGTFVRYWDHGTYKTPDDEREDCTLILTRIQLRFK